MGRSFLGKQTLFLKLFDAPAYMTSRHAEFNGPTSDGVMCWTLRSNICLSKVVICYLYTIIIIHICRMFIVFAVCIKGHFVVC